MKSGGNGDVSFTQTFVVEGTTKVIGKGFGTAAAKSGGKLPATDLLASGDRVLVSYHELGQALHAADVRVIAKAQR